MDVDAEGEDPVVEFGQVERDMSVEFAAGVVVPVRATEAFGEGEKSPDVEPGIDSRDVGGRGSVREDDSSRRSFV